jgi:hypothetical protein
MNNEVKTVKTIRDYPINRKTPFSTTDFITEDKSFRVNLVSDANTINLTGIHKIEPEQALDLISDILKTKLDITKGGINVFKYLFSKLNEIENKNSMTFKVDFDKCRDDIGYTSTQSVWYGLAELLDKNIIARSEVPGVYFLNPNFFLPTEAIVVTEYYKINNSGK